MVGRNEWDVTEQFTVHDVFRKINRVCPLKVIILTTASNLLSVAIMILTYFMASSADDWYQILINYSTSVLSNVKNIFQILNIHQ